MDVFIVGEECPGRPPFRLTTVLGPMEFQYQASILCVRVSLFYGVPESLGFDLWHASESLSMTGNQL